MDYCVICGSVLRWNRSKYTTCSAPCEAERKRRMQKHEIKPGSIEDVAKRASELGMSYGAFIFKYGDMPIRKASAAPRKSYGSCEICGKRYEKLGNYVQKYCSYECRHEADMRSRAPAYTKKTLTCKGCGKEFRQTAPRQKYCTPECRQEVEKKTALAKELRLVREAVNAG